MQQWKFLLLGVTGHLSATKILPALAQFAELNQKEVTIDLYGFSRSQPNTQQIENILNQHTSDGKHKLNTLNYIQGEYSDPSYFFNLITDLQEGQKLVSYLAVPPSVFVSFLRNSCPYTEKPFEIVIEKPFGNSLEEAQTILKVIDACSMNSKVHFFDHFLFKTATLLTPSDKQNFKKLADKQIWNLAVNALEVDGIAGRAGYYDNAGAFKDMLPHLLSLADYTLDIIGKKLKIESLEKISFITGQYENYTIDAQNQNSTTDSYFQLKAKTDLGFDIWLESGKKLAQKTTNSRIIFTDGSILNWQIAPEKKLIFEDGHDKFEINLNKDQKFDHTNMLEAVLDNNFGRFVSPEKIIKGWQIYQQVSNFAKQNQITPKKYIENKFPVEFIQNLNLNSY